MSHQRLIYHNERKVYDRKNAIAVYGVIVYTRGKKQY